jgi:hypothetical protein
LHCCPLVLKLHWVRTHPCLVPKDWGLQERKTASPKAHQAQARVTRSGNPHHRPRVNQERKTASPTPPRNGIEQMNPCPVPKDGGLEERKTASPNGRQAPVHVTRSANPHHRPREDQERKTASPIPPRSISAFPLLPLVPRHSFKFKPQLFASGFSDPSEILPLTQPPIVTLMPIAKPKIDRLHHQR